MRPLPSLIVASAMLALGVSCLHAQQRPGPDAIADKVGQSDPCAQQAATATLGPTTTFTTANGTIYSPDGTPWVARGIDIHDSDLAPAATHILNTFPGVNMIRVAIESFSDSPRSFATAVKQLTRKGIVVEFTDYTNSTGHNTGGAAGVVYTGSRLAAESAWYASMADYYKNNPYVWFGTDNEPSTKGGSLSQWHLATYNAIRGVGNNNPILLEPSGTRPIASGGVPLQAELDPSVYTTMTNVIWDPHVYGYQNNYNADPASNAANVQGMITSSQTIKSADGLVPVIIGEYGIGSSNNLTPDANAMQMVQAVIDAANNGHDSGAAAWAYDSAPITNVVDTLGRLTAFGRMVQHFIAAAPKPTQAAPKTEACDR
jgi:hypothetical protein